jgi:predicted site-specific integrase-resolvase
MNADALIAGAESAFLTPRQLRERWQIAERTLREWNRRRVLPCYKLGGKFIRYRLQDVEEFESKGWRAARMRRVAEVAA